MKVVAVAVAALVPIVALGQVKPPEKLRGRLDQNHANKKKVAHELAKTKKAIKRVASDIKTVDARLETVEAQLEETTQTLADNRRKQVELGKELEATTRRLAAVKSQVSVRLRRMYVRGPTSFLSVLVGTKSVGDLVSRKNLQDAIAKEDHRVFSSYRELKVRVADHKRKQDDLVNRIARDETRQKAQQSDLEEARQEKNDLLSGLKDQRAKQEEALRQIQRDEAEIEAQIREYLRRAQKANAGATSPNPVFRGRLSKPVNAHITSGFGMRYHPILHYTRLHAGCDFGAPSGSPIMAAGDGVVISAAYMRGFGNTVIIDHGGGMQTVYAHASRIFVRGGQAVRRGERIAAVGATGLATAPHLHFEVHVNGKAVNPLSRL